MVLKKLNMAQLQKDTIPQKNILVENYSQFDHLKTMSILEMDWACSYKPRAHIGCLMEKGIAECEKMHLFLIVE